MLKYSLTRLKISSDCEGVQVVKDTGTNIVLGHVLISDRGRSISVIYSLPESEIEQVDYDVLSSIRNNIKLYIDLVASFDRLVFERD